MSELVLHPEHWLFKQCKHPLCPECKREIFPMTPITVEDLPDGKKMIRHQQCSNKEIIA